MRLRFIGGALLALGVALVVLPFALSMPSRASDGADMVNDFHPIMQPASVAKTVKYYALFQGLGSTFGPIMTQANVTKFKQYQAGLGGMQREIPGLMKGMAQAFHMTSKQLQAYLGKNYPAIAQGFAAFPQMGKDFGVVIGTMGSAAGPFQDVPKALTHYGDLVKRMQRNVGNYASVDALPSMRAFTWFFVIPGVLVLLLGALVFRAGAVAVTRSGSLTAQPAA
jgi:hypothetical protein